MIFEGILNIFKFLLTASPIFAFINLPHLPADLLSAVDDFLDMIFSNAGVLGFFIRPATLEIVIPILLSIFAFDKLYFLVLWILKKIPLVSVR